jgi:hypothetical protein
MVAHSRTPPINPRSLPAGAYCRLGYTELRHSTGALARWSLASYKEIPPEPERSGRSQASVILINDLSDQAIAALGSQKTIRLEKYHAPETANAGLGPATFAPHLSGCFDRAQETAGNRGNVQNGTATDLGSDAANAGAAQPRPTAANPAALSPELIHALAMAYHHARRAAELEDETPGFDEAGEPLITDEDLEQAHADWINDGRGFGA